MQAHFGRKASAILVHLSVFQERIEWKHIVVNSSPSCAATDSG